MKGESGVTRCVTEETHSWDIKRDQMEGESGDTRTIIDDLYSSDILHIKWKVKVVLLEV